MFISINEHSGWDGSGGIFDCIVEGTREKFSSAEQACAHAIYLSLDDQGQSFITLNKVSEDCFNIFYKNCSAAMREFTESKRGKEVPSSHVLGILWNWGEVLRLMREDDRYIYE